MNRSSVQAVDLLVHTIEYVPVCFEEVFETKFPIVSVVIAAYNRADLLGRALDSVLAQTFKLYEIIVVDDGSTDGTEEVVKTYQPACRYMKHDENLGNTAALKTGIVNARGKYIAFLDSDDEWMPAKLEKQVACIESFKENEHCVTYTQLIRDEGDRRRLLPVRGKLADEELADYLFVSWGQMQNSTLLIPRALLLRLLPFPNPRRHQDWDMCLRLERLGAKFHFLEEPLTIWYADKRKDRISNNPTPSVSLEWIQGYRNQISKQAYDNFIQRYISPFQTPKKKSKKKHSPNN